MSNKNMFLYWGSGSAPCWKPMIVLAEKGLWEGCPNKLMEFSKKEHKSEEVVSINPRGQLPTFKDGDVTVNESGAICLYLEDKYSSESNKLLPAEPEKKAAVYQRMFEADNLQANIAKPLVYYKWMTKKEDWDEKLLAEKTEGAKEELSRWDKVLDGKDYLCGDKFTLADVFVFPLIAFFVRSGATLSGQPNLKKFYDRVAERESVKATWPPHWKDSEGPGMLSDL